MRRIVVALLAAVLFALPLFGNGAGLAAPPENPSIRLKTATFRPSAGERPSLPPGLTIAGYAQNQRGYYIVQFAGPVEEEWKAQLAAAGAELLDYIPDFAFKVRMNPAQARRAESLPGVAWVGLFQPAYKLSPNLVRDGVHLYRVRVERGADGGLTRAAIAATGTEVLRHEGNVLLVAADSAQVEAIAQVLDVAWVENFMLPQKHNEYGAGAIIGAGTANTNGYNGSTQTVAVADTGLGGGSAATAHSDIPGSRVVSVHNWPGTNDTCWSITDDGAIDVDSGHGTHVAVSVLGDGGASGEGIGTAPAARLVFQSTENWATMKGLCAASYPSGYYLTGIPSDLRPFYQQAYDAGARIHSNSWGSDAAGDYTLDSANTDTFVWTHRDMVITFSAGNAGIDANRDGVVDNDSTGSPATAKNVITVGASENDRQGNWHCDAGLSHTACASQGGQNDLFTYGTAWPDDFPVGPVGTDPSAGNAQQMAAFSSRGPADDGRIKPDIVAPGTWILSGYSDLYQEGYDSSTNPRNNTFQYDGWGFPLNRYYKYMGGTSMSNPIVAGGAAVMRDYYQKAHSANASAALVKASLINSAVDLLDENNDGANDNDFPVPNNHEGWGRVDLASATDGSSRFVDNGSGVSTNGSASYQYTVGTNGTPFKVTLVWSDYASTEAAAKNLVNDLDLTVTAPNGTVYRGNVFAGGWTQTGGTADRVNNVENVFVQSAGTGTWTVRVSGYNVPSGPQPFALVVDGASGVSTEPTPVPTNTPVPSPTPTTSTVMHVGDIDASASGGGNWTANVIITVHDANHTPVANATVSGSWSNGATGTASCITNSSGQCTIGKSGIAKRTTSVTFTVGNVSRSSYTYSSGANHDPDGSSNGTTIIVAKP
ncbi:MAG TPA: S8 family serine peptidase [Ardenticatenaceae bacterium]